MEEITPLLFFAGLSCFSIVFTVALAYITGHIAKSKGYNFWLGFGVGIVAWLPAFIILLLIPTKGETPVSAATPHFIGTQKACPVCNNINPTNATGCLRCGMAFTASVLPPIQPDNRVCSVCGDINSASNVTCRNCGVEFAV
jgi:ribosomal protein L40E